MNNTREQSMQLLEEYIANENLRNHCYMVAQAMEAYATSLELTEEETELWWTAGLLHDLDWEKYPHEHPNVASKDILPGKGYDAEIIHAINAHAPHRTGVKPETLMDKYLFACDELSGFLNACSLVRPTKFDGMEVKSVTKRLKSPAFAANVSRDDIKEGAELIQVPIEEHIAFMIKVFSKK